MVRHHIRIREMDTADQMEVLVADMIDRRIMYDDLVSSEDGRPELHERLNWENMRMSKSSDPIADRYTEMKDDDERMIVESGGVVYNTHRLNDETRKIMLDQ